MSEDMKRPRAQSVLTKLKASQSGVLSVQCLSEFYRVVTQRLTVRLHSSAALLSVEELAASFPVIPITRMASLEACRLADRSQLSIWDALIWAVAKLNEVPVVLTEDSEHGRLVEGVRYLNPFGSEFDESILGGP